jgi:hypothetical protein
MPVPLHEIDEAIEELRDDALDMVAGGGIDPVSPLVDDP